MRMPFKSELGLVTWVSVSARRAAWMGTIRRGQTVVSRCRHHHEVLCEVVLFVKVQVVNLLTGEQRSAKAFGGDESMLVDPHIGVCDFDLHVAIVGDGPGADRNPCAVLFRGALRHGARVFFASLTRLTHPLALADETADRALLLGDRLRRTLASWLEAGSVGSFHMGESYHSLP